MSYTPFPAFDFQYFAKYLTRGLWPFLVMLVLMVPGLLLIACAFLPLLLIPLLGLHDGWIVLPVLLTILCYLAAIFIVSILSMPIALRAALTQSFTAAFNFAWLRDFVSKVWPQLLLGYLLIVVTSLPLMLVGYCMCLVGVYPAIALMMFAQWQLLGQLYAQYLGLGGTAICPKA